MTSLLKNKLLLQKHYHCQEVSIDGWPFWMFEENIKIVNELADEEEKTKKKEEEKQKQNMPNFNANSILKDVSSVSNKFKK